jgi:hypothetical protein
VLGRKKDRSHFRLASSLVRPYHEQTRPNTCRYVTVFQLFMTAERLLGPAKIDLPGDGRKAQTRFPGGRHVGALISTAKYFWEKLCTFVKRLPDSGEKYQNQEISSEIEKKIDGRGRPSIADNFLVGTRNAWVSLLEESWPDVGWGLLSIRKRPRSSIQDIQSVLAPLKEKSNGILASALLRQAAPGATTSELIRQSRKSLSDLDQTIRRMSSEVNDAIWRCNETTTALEQRLSDQPQRETIENECIQRYVHRIRLQKNFPALEQEAAVAARNLADEEANFCQTQLLKFLTSRGRYVIEPLSLANVLAGLPVMAWRQSYDRCSAMPYTSDPHFSYRLLRAIIEICEKRPAGDLTSLLDFFKTRVSELKKEHSSARDYLRKNWHDFRIAVEECWGGVYSADEFAFAVTRTCIRIVSLSKTPAQRILAEKEELKD